jgi:hypothetical protein
MMDELFGKEEGLFTKDDTKMRGENQPIESSLEPTRLALQRIKCR